MAEPSIPEGDDRWFLQWRKGGDITLLHNATGPEPLACPKCRAPVIATGRQVICYACGLTFSCNGKVVVAALGRHRWKDSECGRILPYDDKRSAESYERCDPQDLDL